jgi:UDP-glucose 4-epimerase
MGGSTRPRLSCARMRALVTGGAGFIGSHLVDALTARGEPVLVLDDLSSGRRENLAASLGAGAELFEASITDSAAVAAAYERSRPQLVFHLAAQIDVRRSVADPSFDLDVNVGGTIKLLEGARESGVERFVLASTGGAIYGEGEGRDLPLAESADCRPDAPYGQSKFAAEGYLDLYRRLYGLETISLRLGNVYGPRQDPHGEAGVVAIFSGNLAEGRKSTINGTGEQTRDYVYVEDVARANVLALEGEVASGAYNVGTGSETSVNELYRLLLKISGKDLAPEHGPAKPGEQLRSSVDPALAGRVMGWSPEVELTSGLRETLRSFRAL